jgi:multisubunit Na+/H+ antiporter MnhE subunit
MRRLGTWAAFWVVLFPLWLLYEGEWDFRECLAGSAAAAIGATAATVAVEGALLRHRFELRVLARALKVPWQVVKEFGTITVFLVRHPRGPGAFGAYPLSAGGNDPVGRARRAFTALAATYSPNSYVIDVDERENLVLAHVLRQPKSPGEVTLE